MLDVISRESRAKALSCIMLRNALLCFFHFGSIPASRVRLSFREHQWSIRTWTSNMTMKQWGSKRRVARRPYPDKSTTTTTTTTQCLVARLRKVGEGQRSRAKWCSVHDGSCPLQNVGHGETSHQAEGLAACCNRPYQNLRNRPGACIDGLASLAVATKKDALTWMTMPTPPGYSLSPECNWG